MTRKELIGAVLAIAFVAAVMALAAWLGGAPGS
jgi:preprotein translocase subunit SecE